MKFNKNIISIVAFIVFFLFFNSTSPVLSKSSVRHTITCELKGQYPTPQDGNSTLFFEGNEEDFNCKKEYKLIKTSLIRTEEYSLFHQIYSSKALCLVTKTSCLQKINLRLCYCVFRI